MPVSVPTIDEFNALATRVGKLEAGTGPSPPKESADGTTVNTVGPAIMDALGNLFTITVDKHVGINGAPDTQTANVVQMYYKNHVMSHQNTAFNWYAAAMTNGVAKYTQVPDPTGATPVTPTGMFSVDVHGFKDGTGKPWRARGTNGSSRDAHDAFGKIFGQLPAMSIYRLTSGANESDALIAESVLNYTSKGCVVLIEDHSGNRRDLNWYTKIANTYKTNNLVMIGVPNEPGGDVVNDQIAVINAIKATGYKGLIGLQCIGGYDYSNIDPVIKAVGKDQLFLTPHIYYAGNDPNGGQQYIDNDIGGATSRGLWCVFTEFGDAMDGWHRDQYGLKLVSSVIAAEKANKCGALFWAMDNDNHPDGTCSILAQRDASQLTPVGLDPIKPWLT